MPSVYWFDDARDEFESLPERTRDAIERRLHIYYAVKGDAEHCYVRAIRFARAAPR